MSPDRRPEYNLHPEGLTPNQEILAAMFLDTKTAGKARKRYQNSDGSYRFEEVSRPMAIIDFAIDDFEFAITEHIKGDPSAPLSPMYINLRNLNDEVLNQVGIVINEMESSDEKRGVSHRPDLCAGIPTAGVPLAEAYSKASGIPEKKIFNKEENDGVSRIVGNTEGDNIKLRLIDDLASQGITKVESTKEAQAMGFDVISFFVIVDRQQGGLERLREIVPEVKAAMTIIQILRFGLRTGRITQEKYNKVAEYFQRSKA